MPLTHRQIEDIVVTYLKAASLPDADDARNAALRALIENTRVVLSYLDSSEVDEEDAEIMVDLYCGSFAAAEIVGDAVQSIAGDNLSDCERGDETGFIYAIVGYAELDEVLGELTAHGFTDIVTP